MLLNRKPLPRARDLLGTLRVTVFAPDDLRLVKAGPAERRAELDDLLVALSPRYDAVQADYDRVLKHRNAWLRTWSRADDPATLDVWDEQLVRAGAELVRGRLKLLERLAAPLGKAYGDVAGAAGRCGRGLRGGLGRRGVILDETRLDDVGPLLAGGGDPVPGGRPGPPAHTGRPPPGRLAAVRSTASTPAGSPPRGSSGPWPWPCAWPGTL